MGSASLRRAGWISQFSFGDLVDDRFMAAQSLVVMVNEQTPDRMITSLSFLAAQHFGVLDSEDT